MAMESEKQDIVVMPDGSRIDRTSIVKTSIDFYKDRYNRNLTDICDFSEGSEIRTLHESWAVELFAKYRNSEAQAKMKYVQFATGYYLDALACEYHLTRGRGSVSTGMVTFSTTATVNHTITIPGGTVILSRKTGYEYITKGPAKIESPNTPVNVEVYSKIPGRDYDAEIDTLTAFKSIESIRSDIKVTNPTPITGGSNDESDEELRKRIIEMKQRTAYGTATAYSVEVIEAMGEVHDIQFVDPEELTTNSSYPRHYKAGTTSKDVSGKTFEQQKEYMCTSCSAVLFVNGYEKPCPDYIMDDVEVFITNQSNLVVGQKFHVEKAKLHKIWFGMELYVLYSVDKTLIYEHLKAFFNGGSVETKNGAKTYPGMNIEESISKAEIIDVLEDIPGIHQVGYLKLAKYDPQLPTAISQWNNNGKSGYTYIDDDSYVFWRRNEKTSSISYWGLKHFTEITVEPGSVIHLSLKKNYDSSTKDYFSMKQKLVNKQGELID